MSEITQWTQKKETGRKILFYFMPSRHVISNLKNGRIKISSFDRCNDVFELASFSLKSPSAREKHKAWLKDIEANLGLVCLSSRWRNPLMWAHYAERGTGVCLVFSVSERLISKVEYIPKRKSREPNFSFPTILETEKLHSFCSTKFSAWKYESEYRIFQKIENNSEIIIEDDIFLKPFNGDLKFIGLINGPRPQLTQKKIRKEIKEDFHFFQCRPAFNGFHIVSQRDKSLWK